MASYDTIDGFGTIGGYAAEIIGLSGVTNVTMDRVTVTNLFGTWGDCVKSFNYSN